jgi:hypothetical protein
MPCEGGIRGIEMMVLHRPYVVHAYGVRVGSCYVVAMSVVWNGTEFLLSNFMIHATWIYKTTPLQLSPKASCGRHPFTIPYTTSESAIMEQSPAELLQRHRCIKSD